MLDPARGGMARTVRVVLGAGGLWARQRRRRRAAAGSEGRSKDHARCDCYYYDLNQVQAATPKHLCTVLSTDVKRCTKVVLVTSAWLGSALLHPAAQ